MRLQTKKSRKGQVNLLIWKSSTRRLQVLIVLLFTLGLTYICYLGSEAEIRSASDSIDCYGNVENYAYKSKSGKEHSTIWLKDCEYAFCDDIIIPGMPNSKDSDFLNQFIFSESQCPQGICLTEDYVLITSYSSEQDCKGELMVIDRETGDYLATLGMDEKSHLGGIAFDGSNVWVCNSGKSTIERISYDFIQLMAKENRNGVVDATKVVDEYKVGNTPSCITYDSGRLWVATHTRILGSKMVAYHLDGQTDSLKALSEYQIPAKVQGVTFDESGKVYLSTSYGRKKSSYLKIYDSIVSLSSHPKSPDMQVELPPCSEEIDAWDGHLYMIFESAGEKYYAGTDGKGKSISPLDKILDISVDSIIFP